MGNRVSVTATKDGQSAYQSTHTYNNRDELKQITTVRNGTTSVATYGYDLNGAQVSTTANPGTADEITNINQWDFEGH